MSSLVERQVTEIIRTEILEPRDSLRASLGVLYESTVLWSPRQSCESVCCVLAAMPKNCLLKPFRASDGDERSFQSEAAPRFAIVG